MYQYGEDSPDDKERDDGDYSDEEGEGHGDEDGDEFSLRLLNLERQLVNKWQKIHPNSDGRFEEDLQHFKESLLRDRALLGTQHKQILENQLQMLRKEQEAVHSQKEDKLALQFELFYRQAKEKLDVDRKKIWEGDIDV